MRWVWMILLLLLVPIVQGQQWFRKGTVWYYNRQPFMDVEAYGYEKFTVEKDSLLDGHVAKIITRWEVTPDGDTTHFPSLIEYEDSNRVWRWEGTRFVLKYDLNLEKGDTLNVRSLRYDSISPVIIDSVALLEVDGIRLKEQIVSYRAYIFLMDGGLDSCSMRARIIERIGDPDNFFSWDFPCGDQFSYSGLRCFICPDFTYRPPYWQSHFPEVACDSLIHSTGIGKNASPGGVRLYPNPAEDWMVVEWEEQQSPVIYEVVDMTGRLLLKGTFYRRKKIDVITLKRGYYRIRLTAGGVRKTLGFIR